MKSFIELIENLPPSKTLVKWIVRIAITVVVGVYMFFQLKENHLNKLKNIELGQQELFKELNYLKDGQKDLLDVVKSTRYEMATKDNVYNLRIRVDGQFKKMIDHKDQSDKKLLYDLMDIQRKEVLYILPDVPDVKPDSISIGVRKK